MLRNFKFPHDGKIYSFSLHEPVHGTLQQGLLYEPATSMTVMEILRPGDTVFDVGANVGYFSVLSNAIAPGACRVFAFEPNPIAFDILTANVAANTPHNITCFNVGVSDRSGTSILMPRPDHSKSRLLHSDGKLAPSEGVEHSSVPVVSLDEVADQHGIDSIRLLKIDVEGFEPYVMLGAKSLLTSGRVEYVICEMNNEDLKLHGSDQAQVRRAFEALGYEIELINPLSEDWCQGRTRRPYCFPETIESNIVFNILCRRR